MLKQEKILLLLLLAAVPSIIQIYENYATKI